MCTRDSGLDNCLFDPMSVNITGDCGYQKNTKQIRHPEGCQEDTFMNQSILNPTTQIGVFSSDGQGCVGLISEFPDQSSVGRHIREKHKSAPET